MRQFSLFVGRKVMKKIRKLCLCLIITLLAMLPANVFASDMRIILDGEYLDITPVTLDGRSLIPARYITDRLNGNVEWDADARRVTLDARNTTILLYIDSTVAFVNSEEILLEVPAATFDGRTHIPLRFVAENLGLDVYFCEYTRTIVLTRLLLPVYVTDEVRRMERASVAILGKPYTKYEITVMFATGPSAAQGLHPKYSDAYGNVYWSWLIGSNTSFGTFDITIAEVADNDEGAILIIPFSVTE